MLHTSSITKQDWEHTPMSHIRGQSRSQTTLFPEALEDLIEVNAQVRVIDAFVESLDVVSLGFDKAIAAATGRPGYAPGDLLKLYVYGYLNQVRSSRRLEREAQRNVEVMWLVNRLAPDFKTIADFRQDNVSAIVGACRAFTLFCREQGLFGAELVAIDGSKFQAVASRKQVWTPTRVAKAQAAIDRHIAEYLTQLDQVDADEPKASSVDTQAALQALAQQRERIQAIAAQLDGVSQHVTTEPDAKLMRTANHGFQVSYNVQTAVDAQHSLIVAFEVTNDGNDQQQLLPMAGKVQHALQVEPLTVVADTGYHHGEQGADCQALGITAVVPAPRVVNPQGKQCFNKDAFVYDAEQDTYRCPAGATLTRYKTDLKLKTHYYRSGACANCPLRAQCTAAPQRSIARHFFAEWSERMNQRAQDQPELMKRRSATVEHPFAGLKYLMGLPRFLVRGLHKVTAEMALSVLGYNLKRVITLRGASQLIEGWA
jgi:transposase